MTGFFKVLFATCLFAGTAFAQVPAHIMDFQRDFGKAVLDAGVKYAAATNSMPRKYIADLAKMGKDFQSEGDLDGILAVQKEAKRFQAAIAAEPDPFESVPEMPQDAFVKAPESLRQLQEGYIAGIKEASSLHKKAIAEASEKLKEQIQEYQKDLVKAGKLEDALAVKKISQEVDAALDSGKVAAFTKLVSDADRTTASAHGDRSEKRPSAAHGNSQKELWQNWKFLETYPFSKDLLKFRHPDVPDVMAVAYDSEKGRINFSGICPVSSFQCGSDFCTTVGKAIEWRVSSPDHLEKIDFLVKSKRTTVTMKSGPQLQLAVMTNGRILNMLNVPLIHPEIQIQILRNPKDPTDFIFYWRGTKVIEHFTLTNDSPVNIVLGVFYCNVGEKCDTTVEFE